MKIAITATGKSADSRLDSRFGRCRYFLLYNAEDKKYEAFDNSQNLNAAQGAGIQTAQNIVNSGAEAVITGHCGPKAFHVLKNSGVKVFLKTSETVEEAVEDMKENKLKESESADVDGHWI